MEITPEMQSAIDSAVEAATAGLKNKRDELLSEVRTLRTAKTEAETAAETAADDAARKAGDLEALEKSLNAKHAKALEALQNKLDSTNTKLSGMLIDDTITKSLVDNNVPKHLHAPLTAMFKTKSALVDGVAVHGDQPLADYLPVYWKSEEGKAFVTAPANVGTGSTGVRNATADVWANAPKTPDEQFRFSKLSSEDPALFNNLCDRFGMPERKV